MTSLLDHKSAPDSGHRNPQYTPEKIRESADKVALMAGYAPLADGLGVVEHRLSTATLAPPSLLAEATGHLLTAGGKRIRPALTLICADTIAAGSPEAIDAAVAVELVHLGSLHHDDVIDGADTRRGVMTVNARWTNTIAVLAGDFLLAKASEIAACLGAEPARVLAATIGRLTAGEMLELAHANDTDTTIGTYYDTIGGKTASLMAASCRLGAQVAGGSNEFVELADSFGFELGLAFQIVDDVLDLVGDEARTGKERGIDLFEGVYALPTLLALREDADKTLVKLLEQELDHSTVKLAIEHIISLGGITGAVDAAAAHLARCDTFLHEFPSGAPKHALQRLSRYILERVSTECDL